MSSEEPRPEDELVEISAPEGEPVETTSEVGVPGAAEQATSEGTVQEDTVQEAASQDVLRELPPPPAPGNIQVLQKLSSPPFPRSGFPLLGILASVYEHVTSVVTRMKDPKMS